jgi:FKBP-type peptidyl-prolyl cis-trans isomerase
MPALVRTVTLLTLLCLAAGVPALRAQREKFSPDDLEYIQKTWPGLKKTNTGIRYLVHQPGAGQPPKPGDVLSVLFTGTLLEGTVIEKDLDDKHPYTFRLGRGEVIQGWDQVFQLMKPGASWLIIIPPELAYGSRGRPPRVPPESSLVYEVHLVGVQPEE